MDFKRAFDSVSHGNLWHMLYSMGISGKLLHLLMHFYKEEYFTMSEGSLLKSLSQQEILSPLLFLLLISDIEGYFGEVELLGQPTSSGEG